MPRRLLQLAFSLLLLSLLTLPTRAQEVDLTPERFAFEPNLPVQRRHPYAR